MMAKVLRMLAGLLVGVTVGVGLVLLLTPRSGSELRRLMRERVDFVLEEGRQAAEARQRELTAQFEALKQPSQR
jgi:gas vesicle protein